MHKIFHEMEHWLKSPVNWLFVVTLVAAFAALLQNFWGVGVEVTEWYFISLWVNFE